MKNPSPFLLKRRFTPPDVISSTLDALITAKRKTGRPKDIAVAIELEAIKELLQKKN
jgi:hypothetical protein